MYENDKDIWADNLVDGMVSKIPALGDLAQNQIDLYIDEKATEITRDLYPEMEKYLAGSAPQIRATYYKAQEKDKGLTISEHFANIYVDLLEKEFETLISFDAQIEEANKLNKRLASLGKINEKMTAREKAEREIISNLVLMTRLDNQSGSPLLEEFYNYLGKTFGVTKRQMQEPKIIDDKE